MKGGRAMPKAKQQGGKVGGSVVRRDPVADRLMGRLVDSIRYHTIRVVQVSRPGQPVIDSPALEVLLADARRIVSTGFSVTSTPDGFGATTPGNGSPGSGKGGRQMMSIPADRADDGPDLVPTTSTEMAVFARQRRRPFDDRDVAHDLAKEMLAELDTIAKAFDTMASIRDRYARLRDTSKVPDAPQCYVAQVVHELPWDSQWEPHCRTDFEGKLAHPFDEERPVCRWTRDFVHRWNRLPTRDEMLEYLRSGYVRVATAPGAR